MVPTSMLQNSSVHEHNESNGVKVVCRVV